VAIALQILFIVCTVLLILLILIQKGRGAGLAGAFGGGGGSSAFGTKTADVLTKITAGFAVTFFVLSIATGILLRHGAEKSGALAPQRQQTPAQQPSQPSGGQTPSEQPSAPAGEAPAGTHAETPPAAPTGK